MNVKMQTFSFACCVTFWEELDKITGFKDYLGIKIISF